MTPRPEIDVSVVIPAWNEEGNLRPLIDGQRGVFDEQGLRAEWIVVDGGSADATVAEAESAGALAFRQSEPGYGGALREGLARTTGRWVLTCDGDGSHSPRYLEAQLPPDETWDVIVFSRYVSGGGADQPWHRRMLSWLLNGVFRVLFRVPVRDQSSGFRLYRGGVIRALRFESVNFDVLEEVLVLLHRQGARIREVPFVFRDRAAGASKVAADFFVGSYLRTLLRLFRSTTPRSRESTAGH